MHNTIEYLSCPNHTKEPMNLFCIDKSCKKGLMCVLCQANSHKGHEYEPFSTLISNAIKKQTQCSSEQNIPQQMKSVYVQLCSTITSLKAMIDQIIQDANTTAMNLYQAACKSVRQNYEARSVRLEYHPSLGLQKLNINILEYLEKLKNIQSSLEQDRAILKQFFHKSQQLLQLTTLKFRQLMDSQYKLQAIPPKKTPKPAELMQAAYLSQYLTFNQSVLTRQADLQTDFDFSVCIMSKPLPTNRETHWQVQILGVERQIYLGICQTTKTVSNNFTLKIWDTEHGQYLVTDNGMIVSSTDSTENFKLCDFKFKTGSVVDVYFRPQKGQLTMLNAGKAVTLKVLKGPQYSACVYLNKKGDSVKFIPIKEEDVKPLQQSKQMAKQTKSELRIQKKKRTCLTQ